MPTFSTSIYPFTAPIATSISNQRKKRGSNRQRVQHLLDSPGSTGRSSTYPFKKIKAPQRYESFCKNHSDFDCPCGRGSIAERSSRPPLDPWDALQLIGNVLFLCSHAVLQRKTSGFPLILTPIRFSIRDSPLVR